MTEFHTGAISIVLRAAILSLMSTILPAGEAAHTLAPCPARPNCVSSQASDTEHFTEPLYFTGVSFDIGVDGGVHDL